MTPAPWKAWTSRLRAGTLDWNTPCDPSGACVLDVTFAAWFEQPKEAVNAWKFAQRLAHLSKTAWSWIPGVPAHEQPSLRLFLVLSSIGIGQTAALANRWSNGLFPSSLSGPERKERWNQVFQALSHFQSPAMCEAWLRLAMTWWRACLAPNESMDPAGLNHQRGLERAWGGDRGAVLGALLERVPHWLNRISDEKGPLAAREAWELLGGDGQRFRTDQRGKELLSHSEVVSALEGWLGKDPESASVWEASLAMDAALALWCHAPSVGPCADAFMEKVLEKEKVKAGDMLRQLNAVLKGSELPEERWATLIDQQAVVALNRRFPLAVERWRAHKTGQSLDAALPSVHPSARPRM